MTDAITKKAANKAHALDEASQTLRASAKRKWSIAYILAGVAFTIIWVSIGISILYQNHYALQNKNHIDCIIKDLSTPQQPGTTHKYIDYRSILSNDCDIRFTP